MVIKGQALADFIAEFTYADTTEIAGTIRGTKVEKVVERGDGENSTPTKGDIE